MLDRLCPGLEGEAIEYVFRIVLLMLVRIDLLSTVSEWIIQTASSWKPHGARGT